VLTANANGNLTGNGTRTYTYETEGAGHIVSSSTIQGGTDA